MPSIKDESTVEAIARAFCGETKRNKGNALRIVGYAESTCISGKALEDIYGHVRVKAAIARIDVVQAQIGHRTVENLDVMYQQGFDAAQTQKNSTGMATNTTGLARLYGMDKDNQVSTDKPADLTPDELDVLRADAKRLTGLKLRTG